MIKCSCEGKRFVFTSNRKRKDAEKMANFNATAKGGTITLTKGNDTVKLGSGVDVIRAGIAHGNNTVYNYDSKKDILEIAKGINPNAKGVKGYSFVGNDLIMRLGKTNIRLKNMAGKAVRFRAQGSSKVETVNFYKALPKNTSYAKNDWTKIVANSNFSGTFDAHEYNENLKTFDARNVKRSVTIIGTSRNEVVYAGNYGSTIIGSGGTDTIYLGKGTDVIRGGTASSNNTVYGYDSSKDILEIAKGVNPNAKGVKGYSMSGNDLIMRLGKTNIRLKNMVGKAVRFRAQGGKVMVQNFYKILPKNLSYAKNDWTKVVANSNFSGTFDMHEYNENLKTFDGHAAKKAIKIVGSSRNESIIAGQAGSEINAGKGNDTITCGNGKDRIWFAKGDGKDTVLKSGKNDVAYLYGVKDIKQVTNKLVKGVMTLGIKGASDTLNISGWQAGKSLATVQLANGKKFTFGAATNKFTAVK